ncbi:MAG: phosphate/phosphite/phosphonate ABC transporter substrate-binding protein [Candidatus Aminicenantales bacterium]
MKKFLFSLLLSLSLILMFLSCGQQREKSIKIRFDNRKELNTSENGPGKIIRAAVSAMISPEENYVYYSRIFNYIAQNIGKEITFKQRKTYQEVNELLRLNKLDFAFICSGAYVEAREKFEAEIIAIPKIRDRTYYQAYIIANSDSGVKSFEDLEGKDFAFTDPLSNTGYLYPSYLLRKIDRSEADFFSRIIYTYAHDYSIQAVERGLVTGASVDSLIFDYLRRKAPRRVAHVRIIKKSEPFGMPPVVVNPRIEPELKRKLQSILLKMSHDPVGKEILSHLEIDSFVPGKDDDYDSIRAMRNLLKEPRW